MKTDYEIFEKNRGLLLKKAQKYRLTAKRFIGRYGEHIRVASYKTKELAKNKAERIWDSGKTPLIKQREVNAN